jgi:hypothetical protein
MSLIAEIRTTAGQSVAVLTLPAREFKTGSRGYDANEEVEIDGKRCQVQVQLVEIGSKGQPAIKGA